MKNLAKSPPVFLRVQKQLGWVSAPVVLLLACILGSPHLVSPADNPYLTGQLLVATPEMSDPRFFQAVIYMVRHDKNGAMGLVINKPIAKGPIADLLKSLGKDSDGAKGEIILHYGGPVEPDKGLILHSDDYVLDSTTIVENGIAVTGDVELLRTISLGKGPRERLVMLGHAGWAAGQLEAEIKAGAWFSIAAERALLFGEDAQSKWEHAMDKRKIGL
ncbi:MAG: YqgE/AlgH family protein [Deltaproteobacteria bacterium]|nr:MAG: YqgE/AlgH family protein [Deltaproteobacteria bacterium]